MRRPRRSPPFRFISKQWVAWPALLVALQLAPFASAQQLSPKAERLFSEGLKLAQAGDCTRARERFVESYAADPAPGTLINWALCEEKLGRLAAAFDLLKVADQKLPINHAKRPGVMKHMESLAKRVPFLRLRASSDWPTGATVLKDGVAIEAASLGESYPDNPGAHVVEVRAPGRQDRRYDITLLESRTLELTLEAGAPLPDATPGAGDSASAARVQAEERLAGLVIAGGGLAAIVAGTVTGLLAQARWNEVRANCEVDLKTCRTDEAVDASNAGSTLATVSTASFITGALALGLGGYFIFKERKAPAAGVPQAVVIAGPSEVGLRLRGSF